MKWVASLINQAFLLPPFFYVFITGSCNICLSKALNWIHFVDGVLNDLAKVNKWNCFISIQMSDMAYACSMSQILTFKALWAEGKEAKYQHKVKKSRTTGWKEK